LARIAVCGGQDAAGRRNGRVAKREDVQDRMIGQVLVTEQGVMSTLRADPGG
jgi:hypothetical protein